jgi:acyl carrier protein
MKSQDQILAELNRIFHAVFKDPSLRITSGTTAGDIRGWDSLTHMTLIDAIEKHFFIEFSYNEVMDFANVGEMVRNIEEKQ